LETRAAVIDNGGVATRLTDAEIEEALRSLPGWARDGDTIVKLYEAESFPGNIEFVRRIADLAEAMNHHPDLDIRYTKLRVALSTHDAGGLTALDVELAGQIDAAEG
jgi:4a-hydroxytetrahydrobiopterin dehydratase